jgi:hypothetical protein
VRSGDRVGPCKIPGKNDPIRADLLQLRAQHDAVDDALDRARDRV